MFWYFWSFVFDVFLQVSSWRYFSIGEGPHQYLKIVFQVSVVFRRSLLALLWLICSGSEPFRPEEQLLSTEGDIFLITNLVTPLGNRSVLFFLSFWNTLVWIQAPSSYLCSQIYIWSTEVLVWNLQISLDLSHLNFMCSVLWLIHQFLWDFWNF